MTPTTSIPITESSQPGHARRHTHAMATQLGFSAEVAGKVALVATELATNLAAHAVQGELLVRSIEREEVSGIELIALDRGPGIVDLSRALEDGYSTGGTAGKGLGAIRRNSDVFDVHTVPGKGTVMLAQIWADRAPQDRPRAFAMGVVCLPMPGEESVGDGWSCALSGPLAQFLVVDGLGHGPQAATAARAAQAEFLDHPDWAPEASLRSLDGALRATRGAAAAIAQIDATIGRLRFGGIGNISATAFVGGRSQRLVSHNGTLGHTLPSVHEFQYEWAADGLLVMHSDGVGTSWKLDAYPGIVARHPGVIAATLYRDFARGRDDVTVLVVKDRRAVS